MIRRWRGLAALIGGLVDPQPVSASSPLDFALQTTQEVGFDTKLKGEGTAEQRLLTFPELSMKLPVGRRADVELSTGFSRLERDDGFAREGVGESKVKGRWIVAAHDGEQRRIRVTLRPELKIPAGRAGADTGRRALELDLPVMLGMRRGEWSAFTELAYRHDLHGEAGGALPFRLGAAWHGIRDLKLGLQVATTAPIERLREHTPSVKFAFEWVMTERLALQTEISRTFHRSRDTLSTRAKIELKYAFG